MTKDLSDICNSIQSAYEEIYSEERKDFPMHKVANKLNDLDRQHVQAHMAQRKQPAGGPDWVDSEKKKADLRDRERKINNVAAKFTTPRKSPRRKRVQEEYEEVQQLNEVEFRQMSAARLKKFNKEVAARKEREEKTGSPYTASEKKALEGIRRNIASWDKKDGDEKKEKSSVQGSLKTGIKRKTNMKNVIVAHYLHDEGYTDTLDSAEIMADCIS